MSITPWDTTPGIPFQNPDQPRYFAVGATDGGGMGTWYPSYATAPVFTQPPKPKTARQIEAERKRTERQWGIIQQQKVSQPEWLGSDRRAEAELYYELHADFGEHSCPYFGMDAQKEITLLNLIRDRYTNGVSYYEIDPAFKEHVVDLLISQVPVNLLAQSTSDISLPDSERDPQEQTGGVS